jgi:hypothetical protein
MIVIWNLPHVIVEEPAARVLGVGDASQRRLHHSTFRVAGNGAMLTEDSHWYVAGITV